jgi:hypothetical protein
MAEAAAVPAADNDALGHNQHDSSSSSNGILDEQQDSSSSSGDSSSDQGLAGPAIRIKVLSEPGELTAVAQLRADTYYEVSVIWFVFSGCH